MLGVPHIKTIFIGTGVFACVTYALNADFGLNLLTEFLGVCFTVFVLDRMFREAERRRLKPLMVSVGKDAGLLRGKAASLVRLALLTTLEENEGPGLIAVGAPLDGEAVHEIAGRIRFDSLIAVIDAGTVRGGPPDGGFTARNYMHWGDYLKTEVGALAKSLDRFIERYSTIAPPVLIAAARDLRQSTLVSIVLDHSYLMGMSPRAPKLLQDFTSALLALNTAISADEDVAKSAEAWDPNGLLVAASEHARQFPWATSEKPYRPSPPPARAV